MYSDFYYLGKITKLSGFKGDLVLFLDVDEMEIYRNLNAVFIELGGDLVPFMITEIKNIKGFNMSVHFQDVETESMAQKLVNASLYMPLNTLPKLSGKKFYYHEIVGFEVFDIHTGRVGVLESINDSGAQPLFEIRDGIREILLPLADPFIVEVDRENRVLKLDFPEGLLDLY